MSKIKLATTALASAAALGAMGLVTAPRAAALPDTARCDALAVKANAYLDAAGYYSAYGFTSLASFYNGKYDAYSAMAIDCYRTGGQ